MTDGIITRSSGNVFADLNVDDAEGYQAKAALAAEIFRIVKMRGLTQAATGALLGIGQPKVSALLKGRLDGFSTDRLIRFLMLLGCDVQITVSPSHSGTPGQVQVVAASH